MRASYCPSWVWKSSRSRRRARRLVARSSAIVVPSVLIAIFFDWP